MKHQLWFVPCAIGFAIVFLGPIQTASARGGRGGGGFSRESPAASGGFSSRAGSGAQASRQQYGSTAQSNREQTARSVQSSAQRYHGSYPVNNWDAGVGLAAAATGAAIGAAAASPRVVYAGGQPCAAPSVVPVGDMTYFNCGSAWYTQAYSASGPTFVQVDTPPGF